MKKIRRNKMSENEIVIEQPEQSQEQIPEKTPEEIYVEMFKFASECKYDGTLVFKWVLENVKTVERQMVIWGTYVSEITRYNTTVKVIREDQLKLLKILE